MVSSSDGGPSLRDLPSVDQLVQSPQAVEALEAYGRPLTLDAVRTALEDARQNFADTGSVPDLEALIARAVDLLKAWTAPSLRPVINATGVIIHTNLGRAPLSQAAMAAMAKVAAEYTNLEFNLNTGRRGSRLVHPESALVRLTGAQAALVVNNNAAAVLLALSALARRRKVVIARSQLVEIGGGFRVPDVLRQSGARLLEIGTTNRVHLADYEAALDESPAAILQVHRSNFQIVGFTAEPALKEIGDLARRNNLPLVDDLGSGSLLNTADYGLGHEPMVQESLQDGADLVCFSGDKLVGGPQAGIIVGRKDLVARLRKHPLARAVRADKICLAALTATLDHYLRDEAQREVPIWQMISASDASIKERAARWAARLGTGEIVPGRSTVGGGSLPGETLPTWLLALESAHPSRALKELRQSDPPLIARIEEGAVLLDPRTVLPEQE
ncbi:MAG: L-seryl-tRNA(Sec) selenium transferase, partial [Anaerolineales bacterium]|nr:L-seryl-tRNA(Sec) selenium transferase [Anaerolineales bacterium]